MDIKKWNKKGLLLLQACFYYSLMMNKKQQKAFNYFQNEITKVVSKLSPRERKILEFRFGLINGVSYSLKETGKKFNLTRERIRQIEQRAFNYINQHILEE